MFVASFAEIMSVGAVLPFLGVLTDPSRVLRIRQCNQSFVFWDSERRRAVLPMTLLFVLAAILVGLVRLLLLYATTRLAYGTGHDLSIQVYRRTLYQDYSCMSRNSSEVINGIVVKTSTVIMGC